RLRVMERRRPPASKKLGLFALLGGIGKHEPAPPPFEAEIELAMQRGLGDRQGVLQLTVWVRPVRRITGPLHPEYHTKCQDILRTLRSYMMCNHDVQPRRSEE